jgi:citrate synthase
MMDYVAETVGDWKDDDEVAACVAGLLRGEGYDHSGLVYGMGHAVYTLSDPRAKMLKQFSRALAKKKGMEDRLSLIESVERVTPKVFASVTGKEKVMCANLDLYSGFVYDMLGIPEDLYTPLFAAARTAGWCAHRLEEIFNNSKIMRPAYKAVVPRSPFIPLDDRK